MERKPVSRIADYAMLADCHTNALVGRNGSIDWLCFPRPDSPSLFTHLLDDQHGGNFAVRVDDATSRRHYVEDTNVLCTEWEAEGGRLEVVDCMPVWQAEGGGLQPLRGVVRRLRCTAGT